MPNWCSTSLEIETGTERLAKKVSDKIESWCHECGVENGFGDSWLGNIAVNSNAFPEYSDVSCRGTLEDVWAEGTKVHCIVYSAWAPQLGAIVPVKQDLLGLRAQARRAAAVGTVMGLPRVRCAPRPRRQRRSEHSHGGEARPLQHGRYRGARGNRGGYSRLNARGEDVRPEGTVTVPDGRPRRTENPLVSTMGSVKERVIPCPISAFFWKPCSMTSPQIP